VSHRTLLTAAGVVVSHSHPETTWGEFSVAQKMSLQAQTLADYPGIQPVTYVHLNHVEEELLPTRRYNCWGFTFNPRQCWINTPQDVQNILDANGTQVFPPNLRVGDVVCYRNSYGEITHTGRVWSLDPSGQPALVQSKWGQLGEYIHAPLQVPSIYGTNLTYWRCTPLTGKGDGWLKDNTADDRLPCPPGATWLSPDLWCNPSGGTTHQDPVRGQPTGVYARVRNPDTLDITHKTVRFYWADPNGGIPHYEWHEIGTADVTVGPGGEGVAGPVTWVPGPTVPSHACLLAVFDSGDDYHAATTLDPLVWPFDVARDNNVVQKNISVVTVTRNLPPLRLRFTARNPLRVEAPLEVTLRAYPVSRAELEGLRLDLGSLKDLPEPGPSSPPGRPVSARPGLQPQVLPFEVALETKDQRWRTAGTKLTSKEMVAGLGKVAPGNGGKLVLAVAPARGAVPGQMMRLDLIQKVGGTVTGGFTYVLVVGKS